MSKRNLVLEARTLIGQRMVIGLSVFVITSMGCSGIKSNGFRDWIQPKSTGENWEREQAEIRRRAYATDQASAESKKPITDSQPTPIIPPVHVHNSATEVCDHPDCKQSRIVPKLAFAEPIDYPVTIDTPPPTSSQSLTPMLINRETSAVKTAPPRSPGVANRWQTENPANLAAKPEANPTVVALAALPEGPNPIRIKSPVDRSTNATPSHLESVETKLTGLNLAENSSAISAPITTTMPAKQDSFVSGALMTQSLPVDRVGTNKPNGVIAAEAIAPPTSSATNQTDQPNSASNNQLVKAQLVGIKVDDSQFKSPTTAPKAPAALPTTSIPKIVTIVATTPPSKPTVDKSSETRSPETKSPGNDFRTSVGGELNEFVPGNPRAATSLSNQSLVATESKKSVKPAFSDKADFLAKSPPAIKASPIPVVVVSPDVIVEEPSNSGLKSASGLNNQSPPVKQTIASSIQTTSPPSKIKPAATSVVPVGHAETIKPSTDLKLCEAQFCTEIKGFGQVTPFPENKFQPNQQTLVYCEVENYNSIHVKTTSSETFVTRLRGRFAINDKQGNVVQSGEFPDIEDVTTRRRRDFYLYFPVTLQNLPKGEYQLSLTVEEPTGSAPEKSAAAKPTLRSTTLQPKIMFSVQ